MKPHIKTNNEVANGSKWMCWMVDSITLVTYKGFGATPDKALKSMWFYKRYYEYIKYGVKVPNKNSA